MFLLTCVLDQQEQEHHVIPFENLPATFLLATSLVMGLHIMIEKTTFVEIETNFVEIETFEMDAFLRPAVGLPGLLHSVPLVIEELMV